MQIRLLAPEEYPLLLPTFEAMGATVPHPNLSLVIGAFDGDTLIGFFVQQLLPHVEPMYIDPQYRDAGLWREMADAMVALLPDMPVFLTVDVPEVEAMAAGYGFKRRENVFMRLPQGEV